MVDIRDVLKIKWVKTDRDFLEYFIYTIKMNRHLSECKLEKKINEFTNRINDKIERKLFPDREDNEYMLYLNGICHDLRKSL